MGANCLTKDTKATTLIHVNVKTQANPADSPYFFNFKSKFSETEATINQNCLVMKKPKGFEIVSEALEQYNIDEQTLDIGFRPDRIVIGEQAFGNRLSNESSPLWEVITKKTELRIGDMIKLAGYFLTVEQIGHEPRKDRNSGSMLHELSKKTDRVVDPQAICKICYEGETDANRNPILMPCQCQGSIKYIHLECLKSWVVKCTGLVCTPYSIRCKKSAYECSICKAKYFGDGSAKTMAELFMNGGVFPPYIRFSVRDGATNPQVQTLIHSVPGDGELLIGRKANCHIKFEKENLSREHARLTLSPDNKLFVEDLGSIFGTLRCIRQPVTITPADKEFTIVMCNQVYSFKAKFGGRDSLYRKPLPAMEMQRSTESANTRKSMQDIMQKTKSSQIYPLREQKVSLRIMEGEEVANNLSVPHA